jgi:hypothetical protein
MKPPPAKGTAHTCFTGSPARRSHDAIALTGVVENAESGEHRTFHDIEELWAILAAKKAPAPGMTDEENQPL